MKIEKKDKMKGLSSILSLFRNKFNKINNTGIQMLDSVYHMRLKLLKNHILWRKNVMILPFYETLYWTSLHKVTFLQLTSGLSILLHGVISLPDATSCDNAA